ncbi:sigma-54-dependent Fis family transcriptional regulator [Nitrospirales bacterium NOB]|nr:MAG: sigma-54 dependent DNA-binding response regulator [Nitrospira sp. OLB3]MBV6470577.1 Regulatory protein AtoC [Nitrospirota bacterium]MCE7965397.1 sigma-54-dependent Fis family transcriptional regulator [Nitrospira sp. NTP2]MCK6493021.1 sigma-54 dependent transcriptional regulator [Nitrospira sp.]MDL1889791.1 sigma-54-dependent Fis family transcriptional regulator [Nitrospirales bacterium NOB]MEB2338368.1 sigma-54 dependent transcriptional regulator [Nitrospirales bacterium]
MPNGPPRILIVDDNADTIAELQDLLRGEGYEVSSAGTPRAALNRAETCEPDLILTDLHLPEMDGLALLAELRARAQDRPVVLMTAYGSLKTAVQGLQAGAFDYLSKPFTREEVRLVARRALQQRAQAQREDEPSGEIATASLLDHVIGRSPAMVQLYRSIARVAQTDSTVLLQGESGTGKELIARAVHDHSPRCRGPFVTVDGGALAESLLESELFGHERGAFTGALASRKGLLEKAHGGTCFLDEVADLSLPLQGKLLRVLQEKEIRKVGSTVPTQLDVRIVAASRKPLDSLVSAGKFREDLFYRINVVTIEIPPLRERTEDIPLLAQKFVRLYGTSRTPPVTDISPEAMTRLTDYRWPGNVRELEHAIERAVALSPEGVIRPEDLPATVTTGSPPLPVPEESKGWVTLDDLEHDHILRVLDAHAHDLNVSASILGIHRKTLLRKLRRYGLAAEYGAE